MNSTTLHQTQMLCLAATRSESGRGTGPCPLRHCRQGDSITKRPVKENLLGLVILMGDTRFELVTPYRVKVVLYP